MSDNKQRPTAITIIFAVLLLSLGGASVNSLRNDFSGTIGHWGGVVAAGVAFAVTVFLVASLFRMGWHRRIILALLIPVGVLAYEEIGAALNHSLGKFPSDLISGVAAIAICTLLGFGLAKCCGIRWEHGTQQS